MAAKKYLYAVGRRKSCTAVVKLYPKWSGNFSVRKWDEFVSLKEYFGWHAYMIENLLSPFTVLWKKMQQTFDAEIVVRWWGLAGQAEAIRLWFARALVISQDTHRLQLKPYGLLKRDPRIKERKKPWLRKARKSPQWSKR